MVEVDLRGSQHYPPLDDKSTEELFELGVRIARTLRNIRVRAPVGDQPGEAVVLDGKLLTKKDVEVY